jgi:6-phosphogluconolactonase (cycloisomerase 2 family)
MTSRIALYSAVDEHLTHYELDVADATLTKRATVQVPCFVQYAWPHPSRRWLYVTTSNRGPGLGQDVNHLSAWRIDPESGALTPHGEAKVLPYRAVHMCVTPDGRYTVNAHNLPKTGITIHRINADGTLGHEVAQREALDYGIYPHQVMVTPSGARTLLVDRGNNPKDGRPEDPGALRSYAFAEGELSDPHVVAPNGGYGFGPRHVDFHPTEPWLYVSDERTSRLYMFRMPGDRIEVEPAFTRDTLADRANVRPRQLAGTLHVHPNGRTVYLANRADWKVDDRGEKVFGGGENSIAVFRIAPETGEPTLVQHARLPIYHVRTFALDPSGRVLVAASIKPMDVREGNTVRHVPAGLSVFRVADDGTLSFVRTYDVETGAGRTQYWMGIVGLA